MKLSPAVLAVKRWRQRQRDQGRCIECGKRAAMVKGRGCKGGEARRASRCRAHLDKELARQRAAHERRTRA